MYKGKSCLGQRTLTLSAQLFNSGLEVGVVLGDLSLGAILAVVIIVAVVLPNEARTRF